MEHVQTCYRLAEVNSLTEWVYSCKELVVRWHTLGSTAVLFEFQMESFEKVSMSTVWCKLNRSPSILQQQVNAHTLYLL